MIDPNFFKKNGSFKLGYLAEISEAKLNKPSDADIIIHNVSSLSDAREGEITFLQNIKYRDQFKHTKATACIISETDRSIAPESMTLLLSENPYYTYTMIAQKFYHKENQFISVSELSSADESARIGNRTIIKPNCYIGPNCVIGKDCIINANVTIENSLIGDNVIIHSGARLGQDGFGFAFHKGKHYKVPQLGRVIIENNVEIGANSTIDRGAIGDTVIGEGTKMDNLVHIGHNCKIGKHCIIVSFVGVSGSTVVGDYAVIGGQAGLAGHLKVGKGAQIAARSGVMKDIADGEVVGGYPAMPIKDWHRQSIILKNLVNKKK